MKNLMLESLLAALACIATAGAAAAQGNNSYANMLNTIRTSNQTWFRESNAYNQQISKQLRSVTEPGPASLPAQENTVTAPLVPLLPQYPITATDFPASPGRVMPDELAKAIPGVTFFQRLAIRNSYAQFLMDFERTSRRSNIAMAMAFAFRLSVRAVYGRELSPLEVNQIAIDINNALASDPQFNAMSAGQKQILYETLVITATTAAVLQVQGMQQNNPLLQGQAKELGEMILRQWLGVGA